MNKENALKYIKDNIFWIGLIFIIFILEIISFRYQLQWTKYLQDAVWVSALFYQNEHIKKIKR